MPTDLKSYLAKQISERLRYYLLDLEAMDHEALCATAGGDSRSAYDISHEVSYVNDRFAKRLRGEDPGPWPFADGFARAPAEAQNKALAISRLKESTQGFLDAWKRLDDIEGEIALTTGTTTPLELATICMHHVNYHDAQLNYIQSMRGDRVVHWPEE